MISGPLKILFCRKCFGGFWLGLRSTRLALLLQAWNNAKSPRQGHNANMYPTPQWLQPPGADESLVPVVTRDLCHRAIIFPAIGIVFCWLRAIFIGIIRGAGTPASGLVLPAGCDSVGVGGGAQLADGRDSCNELW